MINPRFWLGSFSVGFVIALALNDIERAAPGQLAAVHERHPELSSTNNCAQCHGGWGQSLTDSCLECHLNVAAHIESGVGLHGTLDDSLAQQCAQCHSEHHGTEFAVVNARSFALAGVQDRDAFDHGMIGYELAGEHLELSCAECHSHADDPVLPEGARRYLGLVQDCATCHADPHAGAMVRDCAECHVQEGFQDIAAFVHDERFPLVGGHANAACRDCHAQGDTHSLEALLSPRSRTGARDCMECHESPHQPAFVEGAAGCVTCHAPEHATFGDELLGVTPEQHAFSGFSLEAPHDALACADCHDAQGPFAARYPGRSADECRQCHEDAHRGYFDDLVEGPAAGCLECHLRTSFTELPPSGFDHARWTSFQVVGAHAQNDCESCHARTEQPDEHARTFGVATEHFGRIESCASCHANPHGDDFAARANFKGREGCLRCHDENSFRTLPHGFDHARWTGFPIEGQHAEASCSACHAPLAEPEDSGRTWERARGEACADCHADPHAGQFGTRAGTDCAACHATTESFSDLSFDHERDSRFPLDKSHAELDCAACHVPFAVDGGDFKVVRYKPLGMECVDCHGATRGRLRQGRKR